MPPIAASNPTENTMHARPVQRAVSLVFATIVTLAVLSGIDLLSQPVEQSAQWAQQSTPPRA